MFINSNSLLIVNSLHIVLEMPNKSYMVIDKADIEPDISNSIEELLDMLVYKHFHINKFQGSKKCI